jgi:hypothetical protein
MTDEAVHRRSPPEAKIALFRSLFRGRDDVYARRFESKKTGKVGYQPACSNEWDRVLCDKRRVKCSVCQNRRFLPLTDEVIRRPDIGLDSYDRLFPNQDTLPTGGFGNLIALPMQKQARERGNSLFLDDQCIPYPDQWAFLSRIQKIGRQELETIVQKAEGRGRVVGARLAPRDEDDTPWTSSPSRRRKEPPLAGPVPETMELVLANQIYVTKEALSPGLRNRLIRLAAFQNPEFYRLQAMRQSTYGEDRIIACAEDLTTSVYLEAVWKTFECFCD